VALAPARIAAVRRPVEQRRKPNTNPAEDRREGRKQHKG